MANALVNKASAFVSTFLIVCWLSNAAYATNPAVHSSVSSSGFKFLHAEELRIACTNALASYRDKNNQLASSSCGSYIQGYLVGFGVGLTEGITKGGSTSPMLGLEKVEREDICYRPSYPLKKYIEDYILFSTAHPTLHFSSEALLGSIRESCAKMHAAQTQNHQGPIETSKNLLQHKPQ